ncbi:type II toxin-antitoxin system RelE/ParE family toxin [Cloacibacillus evryensis]|uniref:Type II toxin-antitoxin system RelE/ParE family toxin n=1 Tax=Cloacibacillus evryensis TaxID=508460 RepID=A0AAW5K4D5_9BACT|nr:type II toxin-antitoxin system RelE/ParE family toxin [Cloacibacillus evryensis]EHL70728.1 RelE/StbE family addiction module toxin [Synergistes sp. 3_1_syn1]MCQ4813142.1 type II toxin-antitoxin system RelE/ParE family toxin [Cloacibacillus evryensis]MEA5036364.1 type II toxin-antitoxin system RelE/ParE family toxin [Cloacibacillus evryensis]
MYKLEFLPVAQRDMVEIVQYISRELSDPTAAERLAEELISAADGIRTFPYANPHYIPLRPLAHEYRKLSVQNYLMFYWADEENKLITVARVLYAKRDYNRLLESFSRDN